MFFLFVVSVKECTDPFLSTDDAPISIASAMQGDVISKGNLKDIFVQWKEETLLARDFQEHDPENQFLDNFPAEIPGSTPTHGAKVRLSGQKWLFHIGNFTPIRLARRRGTPVVDPILDSCKKALPHAFSEDKYFVYPVVRPNKANRVVLDSFRTRSNNREIKQVRKTAGGMYTMVTGKEEPDTVVSTLLNVDRDDLGALKRSEILFRHPESEAYLCREWSLPTFEGQTKEERVDLHLYGEPSVECTSCEAVFGFSAVCYAYGRAWSDVKSAVDLYVSGETEEADEMLEGCTCCLCEASLRCAGVRQGAAPLPRWERGNVHEGCGRRAYRAESVLQAKVKRKRVVEKDACRGEGARERRERRRRRLDDVDLNDA